MPLLFGLLLTTILALNSIVVLPYGYSKFKELHPMRYFFLPEMELFASKTGFEILSAEEWLTGESPSDNTWGTCIILQKK